MCYFLHRRLLEECTCLLHTAEFRPVGKLPLREHGMPVAAKSLEPVGAARVVKKKRRNSCSLLLPPQLFSPPPQCHCRRLVNRWPTDYMQTVELVLPCMPACCCYQRWQRFCRGGLGNQLPNWCPLSLNFSF